MEFCLWMIMLCLVGIQNVLCIIIGIYIGMNLAKPKEQPEKVEIPDPIEVKERKEQQEEHSAYETIMRNIENYDGTAKGQEDVPRR